MDECRSSISVSVSMPIVRILLVPMFVHVKLDLLGLEKLVQVGVFYYGGIDV